MPTSELGSSTGKSFSIRTFEDSIALRGPVSGMEDYPYKTTYLVITHGGFRTPFGPRLTVMSYDEEGEVVKRDL